MLATSSPFPQYFNLAGKPLTAGKLYFGTPNLDPRTSPVTVYWDAAGTIPAAQPIRTLNGYTANNGTPAPVFVSGTYALLVHDAKNVQMAYSPYSLHWDAIAQATAQVALAAGSAAAASASAASAAAQATAAANAAVGNRLLESDVAQSTYTPVLSQLVGVTSVSAIGPFWWLRVKNFVQAGGRLSISTPAVVNHVFGMTLPIKSINSSSSGLAGIATAEDQTTNTVFAIKNLGASSYSEQAFFVSSRGTAFDATGEYHINLNYRLPDLGAPPGHAVQGVNFPRNGGTTFTLNADGTSSIGVNWHTNPAAAIGASYWVRATRTGGTAGSAAPATFTSLAAGAIISISPSAPMNGTLEFSRSASGTSIEAVSTFTFT